MPSPSSAGIKAWDSPWSWVSRDPEPPGCSTFHYLFARLDCRAFEQKLREWVVTCHPTRAGDQICIDGKALRGTQGHEITGVRVLAAYARQAKSILDQIPVDAKTDEHKIALELLETLPVKGALVSGDAMFCQRDPSWKINEKRGIGFGR